MGNRTDKPRLASNREGGFTLIEATVTMFILLLVLVVSFTLLFSMRSFARRQQLFAEPRQTARRAVDYISSYVRGASDMNVANRALSNALVMWVYRSSGPPYRVSFDNIGSLPGDPANAADPGTDVLTLSCAVNARSVPISDWPAGGVASGNIQFDFRDGCPNNTQNLLLFEQMTGCTPANLCDGSFPTGSSVTSGVLTFYNSISGDWMYYVITTYQTSDCNNSGLAPYPDGMVIQVNTSPGLSNGIDPPGGSGFRPDQMAGGVEYNSFRVYQNQLQQKKGLFDPLGNIGPADSPGSNFTPLLDNVEDLQFAYIYDDGTIRNGSPATQLPLADSCIPEQNASTSINPTDITHVIGLRVTVVARSSVPLGVTELLTDRYPLLSAEDHTPVQPAAGNALYRYIRHRLSATIMVRSRMLGG